MRHGLAVALEHLSREHFVPRPFKVLFLDHTARLSGAELALARLLTALDNVHCVVILGEDGPLVTELEVRGIDVRVLSLPARTRERSRHELLQDPLGTAADLLGYLRRLNKLVAEIKPDIIHTNSLKAHFYGGVVARLRGVPQVWHARDIAEPPYVNKHVARLVRIAARVLPRVVISNSRATAHSLGGGVSSVVLPSPILDVHEGRPLTRRKKDSPGIRFIMVGRLAPWKGQDIVIEAFSRSMTGSAHTLDIVGSAMFGEDDFAGNLVEQVARLGLDSQVKLLGFHKDVTNLLEEADVLIHYSTSPEPFGQVITEGMGAGLAVLAAGEGGPLEIIEHGVDGWLVTPRDAGALSDAMKRLAQDAQLRQELGAAAVESSKRYSASVIGAQTERLYTNLMADRM